ncbi:hypothetical protein PV726_31965 [Streptomyces europaeiscabiei]|uniref:hypothetical protein n=1 Tax=Streptomyces europaeiscabiei TaxID=146819 RepID=UPI0029B16AEC|nr:hypothetical protein [Streptomyces europaeiscabiei]MDX3694872.1 hypothetical protein [Streptomyces europaeiscabiei]
MSQLFLSVIGTLLAGYCLALFLRAAVRYEFSAMCVSFLAFLACCALMARPMLLVDLAQNLAHAMFRLLVGTPQRAKSTPHPDPAAAEDGLPWVPIAMWAGIAVLAVLVVLTLGRLLREIRAHRRQAAEQARRRAHLESSHEAVLDAYAEIQINLLDHLDRIALTDVTVRPTADLIHALDIARDARIPTGVQGLDAYREAVTNLELAWKIADRHARATGADYLSEPQRRKVRHARAALALASDPRGHGPQRHLALQRAVHLLEHIVPVPREVVASLEARTRPVLAKE